MKSKITCMGYTPCCVVDLYVSVIEQWEEYTGLTTNFTVSLDTGGYRVAPVPIDPESPAPNFKAHDRLGLVSYHNYSYRKSVGTYVISEKYFTLLGETLGVENILDIQPYEYGIVKIKHGLDKNWFFFPSQVRELLGVK